MAGECRAPTAPYHKSMAIGLQVLEIVAILLPLVAILSQLFLRAGSSDLLQIDADTIRLVVTGMGASILMFGYTTVFAAITVGSETDSVAMISAIMALTLALILLEAISLILLAQLPQAFDSSQKAVQQTLTDIENETINTEIGQDGTRTQDSE